MIKSIGLIKEPIEETRICLIPETASRMIRELGISIRIERGYGAGMGIQDEEFADEGVIMCEQGEVLVNSDALLFVHPYDQSLVLKHGQIAIGMVDFKIRPDVAAWFSHQGVKLYSLDMLPRITKAQSMDVLSSMSSLTGYKAVIKAAELYGSVLPMFNTAAGTLVPAKVLVLGAGVAGLQAIATARRLGAVVAAFDVRSAAAEQVESLGASFIKVPGALENDKAGGYAITQSDEFIKEQRKAIHDQAIQSDLVICTANVPGKPAPLLLMKDSLESMKPGSVIVDLASANGGNTALTQDGRLVYFQGIKIFGGSDLIRSSAIAASKMLAGNYFAFVKHLINTTDPEDDILNASNVNPAVSSPAFSSMLN